jgi:hypothetical protein
MSNNQDSTLRHIISFRVASLVVIGRSDPEMADMVNPNGDIYDTLYFVEGHTGKGSVFRHLYNFGAEFEADDFLANVTKAVANGVELNNEQWAWTRYSYGSQEWQDNDQGHKDFIEEYLDEMQGVR